MLSSSIEQFIANTISENFVNSSDTILNIGYIDIYWHTNTQATVVTNAENGLYNFHTFLINCRQYKNIYIDFKFENGRLRIDIENKRETTKLIDTTLPEVTDYNKIYEADVTAKVQVYIREDGSEYNLYLKKDRTTTTNKNDPDRVSGKIEVISVDTTDKAEEEALNVMKGNNYKHLVEFKIAKTSKLMDITQLHIGRPIRIKTEDDIYDSYISAITLSDENFVYFKSGSLRITLLDKLKKTSNNGGDKLDRTGGKIFGGLNIEGSLQLDNKNVVDWINSKQDKQKHILKAILTTDNTVLTSSEAWASILIPMSQNIKLGSLLSFSNGQIVVGSGVHHVKISSKCIISSTSQATLLGLRTFINSSEVSSNYINSTVGEWDTLSISESVFNAQEGDTISAKVYVDKSGTKVQLRKYSGSTFLQVEVVD